MSPDSTLHLLPYYVNRSLGSTPVAPGNKERLLKLDAKVV